MDGRGRRVGRSSSRCVRGPLVLTIELLGARILCVGSIGGGGGGGAPWISGKTESCHHRVRVPILCSSRVMHAHNNDNNIIYHTKRARAHDRSHSSSCLSVVGCAGGLYIDERARSVYFTL